MRSIGVSLMSTSSTLSRLVGLEIVRLHRHALDAEAVILQDQFLGDLRIFHALTTPVARARGARI
jgi:hypothetical protein